VKPHLSIFYLGARPFIDCLFVITLFVVDDPTEEEVEEVHASFTGENAIAFFPCDFRMAVTVMDLLQASYFLFAVIATMFCAFACFVARRGRSRVGVPCFRCSF
jgi:hypothetical protein